MTAARRVLPRIGVALLLAVAIAWAVANRQQFGGFALGVGALGAWAPLAYIGLYVVATILFLPGSVLGLAGGALFGPVWGAVYTLLAATAGATLAFLTARYVASDWVARKAGGRLKRLIEGVDAEGWRFVAFVRLVPLFPFNLLNYALGLTRIRPLDYIVASFVCMAPGTIAYTYLGYAGREALAGGEGIVQKGLLALGLFAAVAFLPRLVRRLRRGQAGEAQISWIDASELAARLGQEPRPVVVDVRGPDEFTGEFGHLDGARNISVAELPQRVSELASLETSAMVLVCRTQIRSAKAASMLKEAGIRNVLVLRGGMAEWNRCGFSVAREGVK
ncbi:MAG TPA: VTT domain-containing protein [Stellaceae bacterium]|nr:VTT domain-containing protein [Stellaceae bacterium]